MRKKIALGLFGLVLAGAVISVPKTLEKVDAGEYKVVQHLGGKISVLDKPGWQYTGVVSEITEYKESGIYYFSSSELDGGRGKESNPIEVRFRDGALGKVNGNVQFRLPADEDLRKELHRLYGRNYKAVVHNLVVKSVAEAITRSAPHFKGEEAYSYRGADFISLVQAQIEEGIYATYTEQKIVKDAEENEFIENFVRIKKDKDGNPIISKESKIKKFNVEIIGLNIEKVTLDKKTMNYIEAKKDAEFAKIQKRAEAEKAKQDAITAKERGKAKVAIAKAEANVKKQRAVTAAEEKKEVAELKAQQQLNVAKMARKRAEEEAKATLVRKKAEAEAAKLLVKAGLTPKERAEFEMRTKIGVAEAYSKVNVPEIMIVGGESVGADPMNAIGIKMLKDIQKDMK